MMHLLAQLGWSTRGSLGISFKIEPALKRPTAIALQGMLVRDTQKTVHPVIDGHCAHCVHLLPPRKQTYVHPVVALQRLHTNVTLYASHCQLQYQWYTTADGTMPPYAWTMQHMRLIA